MLTGWSLQGTGVVGDEASKNKNVLNDIDFGGELFIQRLNNRINIFAECFAAEIARLLFPALSPVFVIYNLVDSQQL